MYWGVNTSIYTIHEISIYDPCLPDKDTRYTKIVYRVSYISCSIGIYTTPFFDTRKIHEISCIVYWVWLHENTREIGGIHDILIMSLDELTFILKIEFWNWISTQNYKIVAFWSQIINVPFIKLGSWNYNFLIWNILLPYLVCVFSFCYLSGKTTE